MSSKGFNHCDTVADDRSEPSLSINSIDTAHVIHQWSCLKYILYTALQNKDMYFILIYFQQLRGKRNSQSEWRSGLIRPEGPEILNPSGADIRRMDTGARNYSFRPQVKKYGPGKEIQTNGVIIVFHVAISMWLSLTLLKPRMCSNLKIVWCMAYVKTASIIYGLVSENLCVSIRSNS